MPDAINKVTIDVTVNGRKFRRQVEPRMLLVEFIREELGLTGTHIGCDTSYCGACTVQLDGAPVKSCTMFAVQADGCEVLTVEGLEKDGQLHPLQKSFSEHHGLQCGFCTPGSPTTPTRTATPSRRRSPAMSAAARGIRTSSRPSKPLRPAPRSKPWK